MKHTRAKKTFTAPATPLYRSADDFNGALINPSNIPGYSERFYGPGAVDIGGGLTRRLPLYWITNARPAYKRKGYSLRLLRILREIPDTDTLEVISLPEYRPHQSGRLSLANQGPYEGASTKIIKRASLFNNYLPILVMEATSQADRAQFGFGGVTFLNLSTTYPSADDPVRLFFEPGSGGNPPKVWAGVYDVARWWQRATAFERLFEEEGGPDDIIAADEAKEESPGDRLISAARAEAVKDELRPFIEAVEKGRKEGILPPGLLSQDDLERVIAHVTRQAINDAIPAIAEAVIRALDMATAPPSTHHNTGTGDYVYSN